MSCKWQDHGAGRLSQRQIMLSWRRLHGRGSQCALKTRKILSLVSFSAGSYSEGEGSNGGGQLMGHVGGVGSYEYPKWQVGICVHTCAWVCAHGSGEGMKPGCAQTRKTVLITWAFFSGIEGLWKVGDSWDQRSTGGLFICPQGVGWMDGRLERPEYQLRG